MYELMQVITKQKDQLESENSDLRQQLESTQQALKEVSQDLHLANDKVHI